MSRAAKVGAESVDVDVLNRAVGAVTAGAARQARQRPLAAVPSPNGGQSLLRHKEDLLVLEHNEHTSDHLPE